MFVYELCDEVYLNTVYGKSVSKDIFKKVYNEMKSKGIKFDISHEFWGSRDIWFWSDNFNDWFWFGSIYLKKAL